MVELPSFFNREEFVGRLLPGYVMVIVYLILFQYDLILSKDKAIEFDIFSAIVFIIAGPALGYMLAQFQRSLPYIKNLLFGYKNLNYKQDLEDFIKRYAIMRTILSTGEKDELIQTEAEYDFHVSTGIALLAIAAYYGLSGEVPIVPLYLIILIVLSIALFIGSYFQKKMSLEPLVTALFQKYRENPCPSCGNLNPTGSIYCNNCGNAI